MPRISEGFDEFGNPRGHAFDLGGGDEGRIKGEKILFYVCGFSVGVFAEQELKALMAERGLQFDVVHSPPTGGCSLTDGQLAGYTQLWYVSGQTTTLSPQQVQMIVKYVRDGNGLAIWADNDPFYADANLLAKALIGNRFSGNRQADQVMVPGGKLAPGRFVEHQLTQGVNNLYEGITICTIERAEGVTVLGQSHDGQLCFGCFEAEDRRIVLETGFTKLFRDFFHKSAGLGRYLSNIAFWLARGSRGVQYQLLTPGRDRVETIAKGESSKGFQFTVTRPAAITCILQWNGRATLGLTLRSPDGSVAHREESARSPLRVSAVARTPGTWVASVEGVDVDADRVSYVLTLSLEQEGGSGRGPSPYTPPILDGPKVVMPFYLLLDVSSAAAASIVDLNAAMRYIQRDLVKDPQVDSRVAVSLIAFSDSARTVVPLAAPSKMDPPTLTAGGGRSYSAALREYHRAFELDRARLDKNGVKIFRPCVLLLTHGEPDDGDYAGTLRSLFGYDPATKQGNRTYPNVVPIGLGGASRRTLAALAYPDFGDPGRRGRWFLVEPGESPRKTLRSVADAICQSVRETQASAFNGEPVFVPPPAIPGAVSGVAAP